MAVAVFAFQDVVHFDFRRQDVARFTADVFLLQVAKVIGRGEGEVDFVADILAFQCCFDFWEGAVVAAVQVGKRGTVVDDLLSLVVIEFVGEFDDAIFLDRHGKSLGWVR